MKQTIVSYYFGVSYEGGYLPLIREGDSEEFRANSKEELMEELEDAKAELLPDQKLFVIREETIAEEVP